jgi:hypothetical protein
MPKKKNIEEEQIFDQNQEFIESDNSYEVNFESEDNLKEVIQEQEQQENPKKYIVEVVLNENKPNKIKYQILSTGEFHELISEPTKISLLQNRIYQIPVNVNVSTDNENIIMKTYNDINKEIDIRAIENGFAYIKSFKNNTILNNRKRLCILFEYN